MYPSRFMRWNSVCAFVKIRDYSFLTTGCEFQVSFKHGASFFRDAKVMPRLGTDPVFGFTAALPSTQGYFVFWFLCLNL